MAQMYKVFFNDRVVHLETNLEKACKKKYGIIYKYLSTKELGQIIDLFNQSQLTSDLYLCHDNKDELVQAFTSLFTRVEAAGGIVKNKDGKFLFIERLGKWDLPKGKAEKNETIEETARREIEEECGISGVQLGKKLQSTFHTYHRDNKLHLKQTHWFEASYNGNEKLVPQEKEDITRAVWLDGNEVGQVFSNTYLSIKQVLEEAALG